MWKKFLVGLGKKLAQGSKLAFKYAKDHPDQVVAVVNRVAK